MITSFTVDPELTNRYLDFERQLYRNDAAWIAPIGNHRVRDMIEDTVRSNGRPGADCRHFLASANGRVLGRLSAYVNPELKDADGHALGAIGRYECVDDRSVSDELIGHAVRWLRDGRGLQRIWGPLNRDIWSGYRFMTEGFGSDPFYGEPHNPPWYPAQFEAFGFTPLKDWLSLDADDPEVVDRIHARGSQRYQHFLDAGFRFRTFSRVRYGRDLAILYDILMKAFSVFPGYTALDFDEFLAQYRHLKYALDWGTSGFTHAPDGEPIAFVITFRDLADAVRSMSGEATLAAKYRFRRGRRRSDRLVTWLLGVSDPRRRDWRGIGRSLGYWMYLRLREIQPARYLIALMAADGVVQAYIQHGCKAQRRYTLYLLD